jgi:hypothetical protein
VGVTRGVGGHPRPTRGQPGVNSENRSDWHGVTLILVGKRVLGATQVVLSPSERFQFFDPGTRTHDPRPQNRGFEPGPRGFSQAYKAYIRLMRLI